MADILIRGMEMPSKCQECRFYSVDVENGCYIKHLFCLRKHGQDKPSWCPLIALPEGHGDLIERTYPLKRMRETLWNWRAKAKEAVPVISGYIKDAPTIVPAEKEEKKHVEVQ